MQPTSASPNVAKKKKTMSWLKWKVKFAQLRARNLVPTNFSTITQIEAVCWRFVCTRLEPRRVTKVLSSLGEMAAQNERAVKAGRRERVQLCAQTTRKGERERGPEVVSLR